ncbi:MAG: hypothetical protein IIC91_08490 [Chloroflexi bacterium]|nr:hypothetical protein [Chloroflexota bacterium]
MSYSESPGSGRYTSFSSTAVTAELSQLRQQTIPQLVDAPRFGRPQTPEWLSGAQEFLNRYALFAAVVAVVALIAAMAVPVWAAFQPDASSSRLGTVYSSAGVTGTAGTRVADLSAATFLGSIPFVQQSRALAATSGGASAGPLSAPERFVVGARQASVGEYIQDVGMQMVLPYLNGTAIIKGNVEAWEAAVEQQRFAAAAVPAYLAPFQAPLIASGTVIPGARATFYTCAGGGFCGAMANGQQVFAGAAACSSDLPFGTRFFLNADPARTVYTCLDRGALSATWVDIWFYSPAEGWAWQSMIGGLYSDITIVQ